MCNLYEEDVKIQITHLDDDESEKMNAKCEM